MIMWDIIQVQVHRIITISLGLSIQSIQTRTTVINLLLWVHIVILVNIVILFMRAVLPHRKTSETSKTKAKKTECLVPGSAFNHSFCHGRGGDPRALTHGNAPDTRRFWPRPILVFVCCCKHSSLFSPRSLYIHVFPDPAAMAVRPHKKIFLFMYKPQSKI